MGRDRNRGRNRNGHNNNNNQETTGRQYDRVILGGELLEMGIVKDSDNNLISSTATYNVYYPYRSQNVHKPKP